MTEKEIEEIRSQFYHCKDKKILIYGTKVYAKKLLTALYDFHIIGVLDQYQLEGTFEGFPILDWEDIKTGMADILIIGSNDKYYNEIYRRIIYPCVYLGIAIFAFNGQNLDHKLAMKHYPPETAIYFKKNVGELKNIIDSHDAVSFDLFDTLVMRRVLEPMDIFDLVEEKMAEKGYSLPDFRKKRRTAELNTNGGDIYSIYEELGRLLDIDHHLSDMILEEELKCEKDNLILRTEMAEVFRYAVSKGKRVNIITDMYWPSRILREILSDLGIHGFENLYVSCEYGKSKCSGLFEDYKKNVKGFQYLHIGDNKEADVAAAERHGIEAYEIKSGYDLLKLSSMRQCLIYVRSKFDKRIIGELVSLIFNSPFSLLDTAGIVHIRDYKTFAYTFFAPLIVAYMEKLKELLEENGFQGVLFTSRDGYLFKKIYDAKWSIFQKENIPSFYLLTSRRLILKATLFNREDLEEFIWRTGKVPEEQDFAQAEEILAEAEETRENYFKYLNQTGVDFTKNYLICDLISQGTVLKGMNQLFQNQQRGLFMAWSSHWDKTLPVDLVYDGSEWQESRFATCVLEKVFTSLDPSVVDMDKEGLAVYAKEERGDIELEFIKRIHKEMIEGVERFYQISGGKMNKKLSQALFYSMEDTAFCGEVSFFNDFKLLDDLSREVITFKRG